MNVMVLVHIWMLSVDAVGWILMGMRGVGFRDSG